MRAAAGNLGEFRRSSVPGLGSLICGSSFRFGPSVACGMALPGRCDPRRDDTAVEQFDGGVHVTLDGKPFADYLIHNGPKPIVWPIIGPGGHEMTRNYPDEGREEKRDHPHHRSLWFTHGNVNGIDFWSETPAPGKQVHREFRKCEAADGKATISTVNDWIGPDGKKHCEDVPHAHASAATPIARDRFRHHAQGQRRTGDASATPRKGPGSARPHGRWTRGSLPARAARSSIAKGSRIAPPGASKRRGSTITARSTATRWASPS